MRALLLAAVALLPSGARPSTEPGPDPFLAAIPEDAVLVLTTARWDDIRARAAENAWARFLRDEAFAPIYDLIPMDSAVEHLRASEDWGWVDPPALFGSVRGRVAAFLAPAGSGRVGGGFLVETGEEAGALLEAFERFRTTLGSWAEPTVEEHGGATLTLAARTGPEVSEDVALVCLEREGLVGVVLSDDASAALGLALGIVDRFEGKAPAAGFVGALTRRGAKAPAFEAYFLLQEAIELFGEGWGDSEGDRVLRDIGLGEVRWIHVEADIGAGERLDLRFDVHLPRETLLGRFADLFGTPPAEMLALMPAESTSVALSSYDVWGAWQLLKGYLDEHHPDEGEGLRSELERTSSRLGADVEHDLLAQLTGALGTFEMKVPEEEASAAASLGILASSSLPSRGVAYVIGLRRTAPVEDFVQRMLEAGGMAPAVETVQFEGVAVRKLPLGFLNLEWAFLPDGVVISPYPTPLRAVLLRSGEGDAPTVVGNERYTRALERLRGASVVSVADTRSSMEAMLTTTNMLFPMLLAPLHEVRSNGSDPDAEELERLAGLQLPPPELAAKYFQGVVTFSLHREGDVLTLRFGTR